MATTSPDNIWTQDSADNYDLVVDAAATATSIQTALVARANSYKGTTAQRTAFTATAPEGTTWADTNGDKILWIKQGAVWVRVWPAPAVPVPPALGNITYSSGWATNSTVTLTRCDGRIFMDGLFRPAGVISGGSYVTVATIPVNARPGATRVFSATGWIAGTSSEYLPRASVYVAANGVVYLYPVQTLTGVFVDGISWPATT